MAKLADLAQTFATQERPAGNLLDEETVLAQAVAATRFYAGFAALRAHEGVTPVPDIDGDDGTPLDGDERAIAEGVGADYSRVADSSAEWDDEEPSEDAWELTGRS